MNKYSMIIKVYEAGSISKAAAQTSYSQSAVSQVISSVEGELGFPLFKRLKTGVTLTEEGKKILPAFQNIAREEENIRQTAHSITRSCEGKLTIGSIPGVSRQWLPDIIKNFSEVYPKVTYELVHGTAENIQKELCEGNIDCGFTTLYPVNNELEFTPLQEDEFLILLPKEHPAAKMDAVALEDIAQSPLLITDKGLDSGIPGVFAWKSIIPNIYLQGRDVIGMIRMIENGLGIGVFSGLSLAGIHLPEQIVYRKFREPYRRTVGISVRKNQKQPFITEKFTEFTYEYIRGRKEL